MHYIKLKHILMKNDSYYIFMQTWCVIWIVIAISAFVLVKVRNYFENRIAKKKDLNNEVSGYNPYYFDIDNKYPVTK